MAKKSIFDELEKMLSDRGMADYISFLKNRILRVSNPEDVITVLTSNLETLLSGLKGDDGRTASARVVSINNFAGLANSLFEFRLGDYIGRMDLLRDVAQFSSRFTQERTRFLQAVGEIVRGNSLYYERIPNLYEHKPQFLDQFYDFAELAFKDLRNFGFVTFPLMMMDKVEGKRYDGLVRRTINDIAAVSDDGPQVVYGMFSQMYELAKPWNWALLCKEEHILTEAEGRIVKKVEVKPKVTSNEVRDRYANTYSLAVNSALELSLLAYDRFKGSMEEGEHKDKMAKLFKGLFDVHTNAVMGIKYLSLPTPDIVSSVHERLLEPLKEGYQGDVRTIDHYIQFTRSLKA